MYIKRPPVIHNQAVYRCTYKIIIFSSLNLESSPFVVCVLCVYTVIFTAQLFNCTLFKKKKKK